MAIQVKEKIEAVHRACQQISPIYPDYATRAIQDAFSWSSSLADCTFDQLYLVVFRSVRRPRADLSLLREHDDRAYQKALESGGLLRYFKGEANERGECLSFCLWETREQAIEAAGAAVAANRLGARRADRALRRNSGAQHRHAASP
jgi:hypothetical protein